MLRQPLLRLLWTILLLLLFPLRATAASLPALDLALDQSRAHAKPPANTGRYEDAYQLYPALLRDEPDTDQTNYGLALAAARTRRYSQALLAFERLIDRYPADAKLRRSLADVYLRLGDRGAARRELDLARQYDPTLTEERIARVLDSLESVQSRFQAHGRLSGGVMYDSNANQGPASDKMSLGLFDNLTVHGVKAVDSWGSYLNGMLDAGWRLGEDSPWWFVSDIAFFKRWNGNPKLPVNNDFSWGRAALGLRHMSSRTLAELRVKGEMADQSLDQRVSVLGPEGTFVWAALPNLQLITRAAVEKRAYTLDIGRDGTYWWVGEYMRVLLGSSGHEMTLGMRALGSAVDTPDYSYHGLEASLRLRLKVTDKFQLLPFASMRRENYDGPATVLEQEYRRDTICRTGLFALYNLTSNLQAEAGVQYVDTRSSSPLYTYRQYTFNMGLAWTF